MSCEHKWVIYTPFHMGEPYECCANAGCGITKDQYIENIHKNYQPSPKYDNRTVSSYYDTLPASVHGWWNNTSDELFKKECPVVEKVKQRKQDEIISNGTKEHLKKLIKGGV
jgi:hypothetical protein